MYPESHYPVYNVQKWELAILFLSLHHEPGGVLYAFQVVKKSFSSWDLWGYIMSMLPVYQNWQRGLWIAKSSAFSSKTCMKKVAVMTSRDILMATSSLCVCRAGWSGCASTHTFVTCGCHLLHRMLQGSSTHQGN